MEPCMTEYRGGMRACAILVASGVVFALSGCGGGSSGTAHPRPATYSLSGTVDGLNASGLVLAVNDTNVTVTSGAMTVTLASGLPAGSAYTVTVVTQPAEEICRVANGVGTVGSADVTDVAITCASSHSVLYSFIGNDGGLAPDGNLIQASDGNFYGTTGAGGTSNNGTVFEVTPAGVETVLYSFAYAQGSEPRTLIEGSDGNFYGAAWWGGATGNGTVFEITPTGSEALLYSFTGGIDGVNPNGVIQAADGNLYGTTSTPGPYNKGTFFEIATK